MQVNYQGVIAAASLFFGIWFGHVMVRKIEFHTSRLWLPVLVFFFFGITLVYGSTRFDQPYISIPMGILGITFLWDALELFRQQRRVCRGHAPANPTNPRHRVILDAYPPATTVDLLARHSRDERL